MLSHLLGPFILLRCLRENREIHVSLVLYVKDPRPSSFIPSSLVTAIKGTETQHFKYRLPEEVKVVGCMVRCRCPEHCVTEGGSLCPGHHVTSGFRASLLPLEFLQSLCVNGSFRSLTPSQGDRLAGVRNSPHYCHKNTQPFKTVQNWPLPLARPYVRIYVPVLLSVELTLMGYPEDPQQALSGH